jgi:hypothetical protein
LFAAQEKLEEFEALGEALLLPPTEAEAAAPKFRGPREMASWMQVGGGAACGTRATGLAPLCIMIVLYV